VTVLVTTRIDGYGQISAQQTYPSSSCNGHTKDKSKLTSIPLQNVCYEEENKYPCSNIPTKCALKRRSQNIERNATKTLLADRKSDSCVGTYFESNLVWLSFEKYTTCHGGTKITHPSNSNNKSYHKSHTYT
jgi:hypothetical protein